jgi:hypothetical protein
MLGVEVRLVKHAALCPPYFPHNSSCDIISLPTRREATGVNLSGGLMRPAVGRTRDAVDLPDLAGEGDDVRGVPDEFERSRPVYVC